MPSCLSTSRVLNSHTSCRRGQVAGVQNLKVGAHSDAHGRRQARRDHPLLELLHLLPVVVVGVVEVGVHLCGEAPRKPATRADSEQHRQYVCARAAV
eukprot:3254178-Prymnesium_polylepis.2